jgi:hypothetical protein
MNFHMNGMEKIVAELNGMLKTADDSIKKNPNLVMMDQKEKKKRKRWTPPKGKGKEKVSDEPLSSKPKTKDKSGYETGSIGKLILLYFHPHKERPKWSWYVIWATILVRTVSGI